MKRFYRLLCALLVAGAVVATACSESGTEDTPKQAEVAFDSGTTDQTVYADTETANAINFTARAAWTASVTALQAKAEGGSSVEWLTLDKYSGQAGKFSLKMSLKPNYTGESRKAQIGIACGDTSISITVEQKGTNKDGTKPEDPDKPEPIELISETPTQQTVWADETQTPKNIAFKALASWTATVAEVAVKAETSSGVDWLTLSKYSGEAGEVSLTTTLKPNYTGKDRKAEIHIVCGGKTVVLTIEQKGTNKDGTKPEDPDKPDDNPPSNIQFPDAKFAAYMVENFDTNKDGGISSAEAAAITRIECPRMEIESLEGIEYCTELTYLDCVGNKLKTLDISGNTKLTELVCSSNQLTTLNVSGCANLTCLRCHSNQLTTLDVSNNPELTELGCAFNPLTTLDASKNTKLTKLYCKQNQLTVLDVSKSTQLTDLTCDVNQLTTLDVSNNTELTKLVCGHNQLTTLDVNKNTELTYLSCDQNQLTVLDVSKNTQLTDLDCLENQLTALDISKNTNLTKLSCRNNQLTTLDASKNTKLTELYCADNQLTTLDVSKNTQLTVLSCSSNQLTVLDVSKNTKLTELSCRNNQLTTLDVSKTNLGNSSSNRPLSCYSATLQTLWLKTGWQLNGINKDRSTNYIHPKTEIKYKD